MRSRWFVVAFLFIFVSQLVAEDFFFKIGRPTFTSSIPVELGFINASNGNLHLEIPIGSWPQRAGKTFTYKFVYDSHNWSTIVSGCCPPITWIPTSSWRIVSDPSGGFASHNQTISSCPTGGTGSVTRYDGFRFTEPDGTTRTFKALWTQFVSNCGGASDVSSTSGYADDASGYRIDITNYADKVVYAPDGSKVTPLFTDSNGNLYSGQDTLGRTLVTQTIDGSNPLIHYLDVRGSDGQTGRYTITYAHYDVSTAFNSGHREYTGTVKQIQSIQLPNNTTYTFNYESGTTPGHYGMLTSITLPTGATINYGYTDFLNGFINPQGKWLFKERWVSSRTSDGGTWTYTPQLNGACSLAAFCAVKYTVKDPTPQQNEAVYSTNPQHYLTSVVFYNGPASANQPLKTITLGYDSGHRVTSQTTALPSGLTTKVEYSYVDTTAPFRDRNISQIREWDFYTGSPPTQARTTTFSYLSTTPYVDKNIIDKVVEQIIYNGLPVGDPVARTQVDYDQIALIGTSGVVQHDYTNFGIGNNVRGNPTHVKRWLNTTGGWLITTNTYDDLGNLRSTQDAGNHTTTFSYADDWADSHCPLANTQAYVTLTTNALGHRNANRYYTCTGLVQSTRDENDIVGGRAGTTFTYDVLGRPLVMLYPDGGQTTSSYNDTSLPASITTLAKIDDSQNLSQTTVFDGLGRTQQTKLIDPDCTSGPVKVDFTYDLFGRKTTESNPYCTTGDSTYGVTTYKYDVLGRVIKVIPPDGTESSNNVSTAYSDNLTTVTDQAGKLRRTKSDAFDRLVAVWEPNAGGSLVNQTIYAYDPLDNLLCVEQRGAASSSNPCGHASNPADWRPRQFVYDSLSRLIKATNPESGTFCYGVWNAGQCINGYDVDGNLLAQTDARNITINHSYDQLHRLTGKTYSNGDPSVTYCYDLASCTTLLSPITNGIGRRVRMSDDSGVSAWSYDSMGRVITAKQTILGVTKTISYEYNKAGSTTRITYPSGRIIDYEYNAASRARSAKDIANTVNYAQNGEYAPQGALRTVLLGNDFGNDGSTFTQTFNSRLQPDRTRAFNSSRTIIDLGYSFNLGVSNNGNVAALTNHRDNPGRPVGSVSFTYDELSRVASVQTAGTDCTLINGLTRDWGNAFVYDIWGNLYQKNQTKCSAEGLAETVNTKNQFNGYSYDQAGNLLNDGLGITFTYDAENRIKTSGGTTTYTYDGDGNRVAKSGYRLYWWGMSGNGGPLAETFTSGGNKREYIYFAGRRIAMVDLSVSGNNCQGMPPNCARYYFYPDQVGSTPVLASSSGNTTVHEADFYPFGGERIITSSSIDPHYRFTGKERDDESNLDYFGARYHGSRLARFITPDQPFADQHEADPQSWNLYTYVRNNPVTNIDPTGNTCQVNSSDGSVYDDLDGKGCAEVDEENREAPPSAVVTPSYNQDERIRLLAYHMENLTSPNSLSEVGVSGIEGAMTAEAVWNLPSLWRKGQLLIRAWRTGRAAEPLAQTVLSGSKQVVKANLKSLGLSAAQQAKVVSALRRATNEAVVTVEKLADGSVKVTTSSPGVNTGQSIVKVIDKAGNTVSVEQVHLDSAGRTVVDRKF